MKTFLHILWSIICTICIFSISYTTSFAVSDLRDFTAPWNTNQSNDLLNDFRDPNLDKWLTVEWSEGIQGFILKIAKDFKNLVFALSTIVFLVLVYRLLFATNTEEEAGKFRKWILWTVIWIVVMQLSYSAVLILFDKRVEDDLAIDLFNDLFAPLIDLLLFWASFVFLVMWIFAFFMIITANGDEEKAKKWKMTVFYAIIWFLIIKFAQVLVNGVYSDTYNIDNSSVPDLIRLFSTIINWLSTFIGLLVVIMIIYSGFLLIFGNGDEETLKKAKRNLIYIAIWLAILALNYLIVTFFIVPEIAF